MVPTRDPAKAHRNDSPLTLALAPALVLASASPRRMDLLKAAGVPHRVHPTDVDETPQIGESPVELVTRISLAKAEAALPHYKEPNTTILAADTVVFCAGSILGKPPHEGAARQMLLLLSGKEHAVYTGTCILHQGESGEIRRIARVERTAVTVRPLTPEDLAGYLGCEEWRGKAGAYAIQGRFSCFVSGIAGNYESVVGLPLSQVLVDLREVGALPKGWPSTWKA